MVRRRTCTSDKYLWPKGSCAAGTATRRMGATPTCCQQIPQGGMVANLLAAGLSNMPTTPEIAWVRVFLRPASTHKDRFGQKTKPQRKPIGCAACAACSKQIAHSATWRRRQSTVSIKAATFCFTLGCTCCWLGRMIYCKPSHRPLSGCRSWYVSTASPISCRSRAGSRGTSLRTSKPERLHRQKEGRGVNPWGSSKGDRSS